MLNKKIAMIVAMLVAVGMLSACNDQAHNDTIDVALFLMPSDWLLLGSALILLFLLPVIIIYWPKRSLN